MSASRVPIQVNGRSYTWPDRPLVVVCVDGCEPDYVHRAAASGAAPWLASVLASGHRPAGRRGGPDLHQSQQSLDRHGRAAVGARHLRQLLLRSRRRRRSDDERSQVPARRDDPGHLRPGGRIAGGRHRQGQAAPPARPRHARGVLFLGEGRRDDARGARHCGGAAVRRAAAALGVQRRSLGVRVRRRRAALRVPAPGHHVPLDHRLRAAQARARHAGGRRVLPHDGRLPGPPRRARRDHRADRRPRDERQDRRAGRPAGRLSARPPG